jgi:hypothetical protein
MAKEYLFGQMEAGLREISLTIKDQAKEYLNGLMVESTRVNLKTENSTGLVNIRT